MMVMVLLMLVGLVRDSNPMQQQVLVDKIHSLGWFRKEIERTRQSKVRVGV
jgi:hypothetical protein